MYNPIVRLSNELKKFVDNENNSFRQRERLVSLKDAIVFRLLYSKNGNTQECVRSIINEYIGNTTHRSNYVKADKAVELNVYEKLYSIVCKFDAQIYGKYSGPIIVAVDGTSTNMNIELANEGYLANKNGDSVTGLILGIHNVTRNYPIALELVKHKDERRAFLNFINGKLTINPNNIWVFDRGFYSLEFVGQLISKNMKFICRLKINLDIIDKNKNDTIIAIEVGGNKHNVRIIKYVINDNEYYLMTNLFGNDYSIDILKELYFERWSVEELFKLLKSNTNLARSKEKDSDSIKKSIYCQLIIAKLTTYIEHCYNKDPHNKIKNDYQIINRSNLISGLYSKFILQMFYKKMLLKNVKLLIKNWIIVHNSSPGRSFQRKCNTPYLKWYIKKYYKGYLKDGEPTKKKPKKRKPKNNKLKDPKLDK